MADALEWQGGPFDAVLVDVPCSSTGTIRRHPDIAYLKREEDIASLARAAAAADRSRGRADAPGGTIVYCSCSLEPEEGEAQVEALLARERRSGVARCRRKRSPARREFVTPAGDLRTLPCHWPDPDPRMAGLDGFYAARLEKL